MILDPESKPMNENITVQKRFLPPPFVDLDCVVKNEATGQIRFRYKRDGRVWYDWCFEDEEAARKELSVFPC